MPELTLIYFNARGRAELSRWIMAYGSIPFTDDRIERENWPARKPNVFSNRVPVLMVDGKPLSESMAIARYLAGLADLVPKDPFDTAKVDSICDKLNDMMSEVHKILVMTPDEKEKKEKYDKYHADVLKPFFTCFNKNLEGKDWYIPGKITWADLFIGLTMTYVQMKVPGILDDFPNITTRVNNVMAIPKIKEWNDKQPKDMPF